jgi:hypothetical protein
VDLTVLHLVWKKLKTLFDRVDESHVMQLEKELISLDPHSFERMEDYLACVKELQLKLSECGENYKKKDGQLIELVLINLRTPFDVLYRPSTPTGMHTSKMVRTTPLKFFVNF